MTTNFLVSGQRKVSFLFAACFFPIVAVSVAFSAALLYRLTNLQSTARTLHAHSLSISHAGQEMLADVSRMHNLVLQTVLKPDASQLNAVSAALETLDARLRQDLALVSAESADFRAIRDEITRQFDDWRATHARILDMIRSRHENQALALGMGSSVAGYGQLETSMGALTEKVQARSTALAEQATGSADQAIREAWWMLGGLALFNILCGMRVLRRTGHIMKKDAHLVSRLHESEQRLKMALAGGSQGTWDLDVPTGKLTFDAEWGNLLGYYEIGERPSTMEQWAAMIFSEDRDHVLKAIQDHIEGRSPEYRAEYRIRNQAEELRWVAGHGKAMDRDRNGIATRIVGVTQDITQRKLSEQKIWNLAHTDILTGLPNRVLLYDRLGQTVAYARRHAQMFALFFLDLDGFKQVNDKYGHDIGDKLLQEVAARLREVIRSEDTMARVGGDEFIFLLSAIHSHEDAAVVADKILTLLREDFAINGCRCRIGGSIGISLFPEHAEDMDGLISRADDAMYQAKAKGKNTWQFFQPPADDSATGGSAAA